MVQALNPQQDKAVRHGEGPLLIVAGAGSGKTRTLTERLVHLIESGVSPQSIVAITFTNKAAQEMVRRLAPSLKGGSSAPYVGTFHSFGASILRAHAPKLGRTHAYSIFDGDDSQRLIKLVIKDLDISKDKVKPLRAQSLISKVKYDLLDPQEELSHEYHYIYDRYEEELKKSNAFDFDDLLQKVVQLFTENKELLQRYQSKYQYILVDEFQDTNAVQYELVKLLAAEHHNLNVVGDDAQSIYKFRGSDFRNFLNFDTDWPDATIIKLEQNYRSTKTIITAASTLIESNALQKKKRLWTDNQDGSLITVVAAENDDMEADWVIEQLLTLAQSTDSLIEPAILYRTNAQSRVLEQALIAARIPYQLFGGVRFYERREVKDVVAALRVASNPKDRISTERLEKVLTKKVARELLPQLPLRAKELAPHQLVAWFVKAAHYESYLEKHFRNYIERGENVKELLVFASQFNDLAECVERITLLQSADKADNTYDPHVRIAPKLMTVHVAKGLEFDHVFVVGCNEGVLPHHRSLRDGDELEEERRLMYVAMTRARDNLYLTFSHIPSRFLYEIPPELTVFDNQKTGGEKELPDEDEIYIE
jgi:DNA helicase II / ATP-dependent DNA helicase PcrA